jgi:hypothetical protein
LLVYFSTNALNKNANFMLKVLEHIILTWPVLEAEYRAYNEAVKDFQTESMLELHRLAIGMPDHLLVRLETPHSSQVRTQSTNCDFVTRGSMTRSKSA